MAIDAHNRLSHIIYGAFMSFKVREDFFMAYSPISETSSSSVSSALGSESSSNSSLNEL